MTITVVSIDNQLLMHTVLKSSINSLSDMKIIGQAKSYNEACGILEKKQSNVLVMDITLPDLGGIELVKRLVRQAENSRIIIFTQLHDCTLPNRLMKIGIAGYVVKSDSVEELIQAIKLGTKKGSVAKLAAILYNEHK